MPRRRTVYLPGGGSIHPGAFATAPYGGPGTRSSPYGVHKNQRTYLATPPYRWRHTGAGGSANKEVWDMLNSLNPVQPAGGFENDPNRPYPSLYPGDYDPGGGFQTFDVNPSDYSEVPYGAYASLPSDFNPTPYKGVPRLPPWWEADAAYLARWLWNMPWGVTLGAGAVDSDHPYGFGPGWTVVCSAAVQNPGLAPNRKLGLVPGSPGISPTVCTNSTTLQSNTAWGGTIPAATTRVDLVASSQAHPNQNGQPYFQATHLANPASNPIPFNTRTYTVPVSDPFIGPATQMHRVAHVGVPMDDPGGPPYVVPSMDVTVPDNEPPWSDPGGGHAQVPPAPGDPEDKPIDNTGRSVKDVYGALTELKDLSDCLSANTKVWRRKGHGKKSLVSPCAGMPLMQKFRCLAQNAQHLDVAAFVQCMATQNLTDEIIGRMSSRAYSNLNKSPYNPRRDSGLGLGTGGFVTRMR